MGRASDRYGRQMVLIAMAATGALCSFGFGWAGGLSPMLLLAFAAVYGFTALGDCSVLSTAMSEAVPVKRVLLLTHREPEVTASTLPAILSILEDAGVEVLVPAGEVVKHRILAPYPSSDGMKRQTPPPSKRHP